MSGYCVGNCIGWDEGSGNMTIVSDPLGGTTCGVNGLKLVIAGNTTGIAAAPKNNGLFMTTAGELGSKVNPQRRAATGAVTGAVTINQPAAPNGSYGPYATTSNLSFSNPSTIYPMVAVVRYSFSWDYQLYGDNGNGSSNTVHMQTGVNGSYTVSDTDKASTYDEGNMTFQQGKSITNFIEVPIGSTYTFQARQYWYTGPGLQPTYYSAACSVQVLAAFIAEVV
jgi:hypothetical protein